jgi:hypothetical protein
MLEGYPGAAQRMRDLMTERVDNWTRELSTVKGALEPKR